MNLLTGKNIKLKKIELQNIIFSESEDPKETLVSVPGYSAMLHCSRLVWYYTRI